MSSLNSHHLNFFCQCQSSVEKVLNHSVGHRKVLRQFIATSDRTRVTAIQELITKHSVFHPHFITADFRNIACPAGKDLLEAVEIIPAGKNVVKKRKTQIYSSKQAATIKRNSSSGGKLGIPGNIFVLWCVNKPRQTTTSGRRQLSPKVLRFALL